ncbi:Protein of unknown function DUF262 [Pseudonocardia thermophila]|uniref:GmrSD restriction endonucleases N-terminal domain-containing protein n=1 Tax=Pseudonocardia thermophila TaxID=1848 RepID=A0A1M6QZQ6_PSETH|nr:DUF262 domain-containing protein [Pseudonocardia thermophila]SHK25759.1 Protein of unknown function DUF262 [Pseudonocardia thermophila]
MAKLGAILDQIDAGTMLLPEFQRGYVWNRDQVRGLMRSLYRGYPVGALLVWETDAAGQAVRGGPAGITGTRSLLLDGQQRVTTLYGVIRGRPPAFFEGDPEAFRGLRFNVETEAFEFYGPVKMKEDPRWIDVTGLFVEGPAPVYARLSNHPETAERFPEYVDRIQRLRNILERDFHIETISGPDKTVDVVVDIFNRVNSGGTKLSKGDLALARICAEWADARPTMRRNLDRWAARGLRFTPDWLLRNVNAVATGKAPFAALEHVSAVEFQDALYKALHNIDHLLDLIAGRLGLDHDRVLMGRAAFPVLGRLLHARGGRFADLHEADRALCWYVHAAVRGRFATSADTMLGRDLETIDREGIDGVITSLRRTRKGSLTIDAQDFEGAGRGSRSYPLLYMVTRTRGALDLVTGRPAGLDTGAVEVHEIFPKSLLVGHGYTRNEVNAVANFAFVAPSSAMALTNRAPAEYLPTIDPAIRASQWIPDDPRLWRPENYRKFLAARRKLLAAAANDFLADLMAGSVPATWRVPPLVVTDETAETDARAAQIAALVEELTGLGFARPELGQEILDPASGRVLAVAEAYWPDGLQAGQGKPVVLELDPDEADIPRLTELGVEVFTSVDALRGYVHRLREVVSGDRPDTSPGIAEPEEPVEIPVPAGALDAALFTLIERCRTEVDYNPIQLTEMAHQHGALGAIRRLVMAPTPSDGFVRLWSVDRLDLTVEALVLDERFSSFFTEAEIAAARRRLEQARPVVAR